MKSAALPRLDPSVLVSLIAAGVFVVACGTSQTFGRGVLTIVETAWLYISNTKG